jgi:hypothetical protein
MTLAQFQALVAQNEEWFAGVHPETYDSLLSAEQQLGCSLPVSLKWLLSERGYSSACGIGSLQDGVETTLRVRQALSLPVQYIILNDWGDSGVVYLDSAEADGNGEFPVYWSAVHNFTRLADGEPPDGDIDRYDDYPAWVIDRLEDAMDEAE